MSGDPERPGPVPILRHLDDDLWVAEYPLRVAGLAIGTRMTVVRLSGGGLFLHSPTPLDSELRAELDALGPVRWVVAPSKVHHFYVGEYRAFPEAKLYAAPGLPDKRKDIAFDAVLGPEAPEGWAGEIDQVCVEGAPIFNEVAFFHRASRTLLLTDLAFNFQHVEGRLTELLFRLNGVFKRFGPSRMLKLTMRDKAAIRRSLDRILEWDFERVIVTHGIVLQRSGKRMLRAAYAWL